MSYNLQQQTDLCNTVKAASVRLKNGSDWFHPYTSLELVVFGQGLVVLFAEIVQQFLALLLHICTPVVTFSLRHSIILIKQVEADDNKDFDPGKYDVVRALAPWEPAISPDNNNTRQDENAKNYSYKMVSLCH